MEESPFISKNFLSKEAKFPYGPFYLAARFNKPVCFTFAFKETNTHYHFYSTPGKQYPAVKNVSQRAEIAEMILGDYLVELEKMTLKYPHQWFNFYDFWEDEKQLH
jgi:predicted LPLAT superfamily acyltransferase